MIKVVCWNMHYRRASWRALAQMGADVALLQEPSRPPPDVASTVDIEPPDHWKFWDSYLSESQRIRPHRRPRIAKLSDRVTLEWFTPVPLLEPISETQIAVSDVHTIAAARVTPLVGDSQPFIVVSMYAHWKAPHPVVGHKNAIMPDASAHRIISDLSVFVADSDRVPHRILVAGDLNLSYGGREDPGRPEFTARCRGVWSRMERQLGFVYLGPQAPNGRRPRALPEDWPANSKMVPTHHSSRSSPADAWLQLDHVFASRGFHSAIHTRALNGIEEWGPSDHARLLIEVRE